MPLQSPAAKVVLSLAASPTCAASGTASASTQPTAMTLWERLCTPSQAAPSMSPDYIQDSALVVLWLSSSCWLTYITTGFVTKLTWCPAQHCSPKCWCNFLVVCFVTQLLSQYPWLMCRCTECFMNTLVWTRLSKHNDFLHIIFLHSLQVVLHFQQQLLCCLSPWCHTWPEGHGHGSCLLGQLPVFQERSVKDIPALTESLWKCQACQSMFCPLCCSHVALCAVPSSLLCCLITNCYRECKRCCGCVHQW